VSCGGLKNQYTGSTFTRMAIAWGLSRRVMERVARLDAATMLETISIRGTTLVPPRLAFAADGRALEYPSLAGSSSPERTPWFGAMYMANSTGTTSTLWQTIPDNQLVRLLDRSHTLNGAVLVGLDGLTIEIQARAMNVDEDGLPWRKAVKISGMAKGAA
jgi:hypothetical protein